MLDGEVKVIFAFQHLPDIQPYLLRLCVYSFRQTFTISIIGEKPIGLTPIL